MQAAALIYVVFLPGNTAMNDLKNITISIKQGLKIMKNPSDTLKPRVAGMQPLGMQCCRSVLETLAAGQFVGRQLIYRTPHKQG